MKAIELIREFLHERLAADPAAVVPEAALADLGVDSLMMLELMFEFEDRFAIKLESDLKAPQTVGELATLMEALIAQQTASPDSATWYGGLPLPAWGWSAPMHRARGWMISFIGSVPASRRYGIC